MKQDIPVFPMHDKCHIHICLVVSRGDLTSGKMFGSHVSCKLKKKKSDS